MVAIAAGLVTAGCSSSDDTDELSALCPPREAVATGADAKPAAIALFGDGRLARFSLRSGKVEAARRVPIREPPSADPAAPFLQVPGQLLVQPEGAQVVLVLVRRAAGARDEVLAVDPASLRTRCRYPLSRGVRYRGIDVGDSGRIYAFGYREGRDPTKLAAILTTREPRRGARPVTKTVRPPDSGWFPYWGAVSSDERHLVLSYHGSATGADVLDASGKPARLCPSPERRYVCVAEVHGAVEPYRAGFLGTDGEGMLDVGWNGGVDILPVRPRNVHLMDFALDEPRGLVYVSSCAKRPAVQRLDLTEMHVTEISSGAFCGAPFAVYEDRYLVLATSRLHATGIQPEVPTELRVLDLRHPGPGVPVPDHGTPQDAIAIEPSG
jgi:hypothetical protein